MRPVGDVDRPLDERVDDGLVDDLAPLRVLGAGELLRRDDLQIGCIQSVHESEREVYRQWRTVTLRKWLVRLERTCLSLVRSASGLSTYPARPFRWNIAWLIMYPKSVRRPHMLAYHTHRA